MGKERKRGIQNPTQPGKAEAEMLVAGFSARLDHEIIPWMNGEKVDVALEPVKGAHATVYTCSIAQTYPGDGGVPKNDPNALATFKRVAQAISNMPGFKSDDCLTADKTKPVVRAHLMGRNAKGSATFIYFADMRINDARALLYVGPSLGDKRRRFESRLTTLGYSNSGRRIQ